MGRAANAVGRLDRLAADPASWDAALRDNHGQLLQSWRWGAFKERTGWDVERVAAESTRGVALAQILFRRRFGISFGYIPRGPAIPADDPDALAALLARIDAVARQRRTLSVLIEPDRALPDQAAKRARLAPGAEHIQPSRTVKVELLDDTSLLNQMHQKTRYNIRLAERRGVTSRVVEPSEAAIGQFYALLQDTSSRNDFGIHTYGYYRDFLREFGGDAALIFTEIEGRPVAGAIAAAFGDEAIYMYGGSSTKDRAHGAGFLLQYDAMRWARDRGCRWYDLWGIPAEDPRSTKVEHGDRIPGTTGSDWRGLFEFKTRFGGRIVDYPPPVERPYHPLLASLVRRLYRPGG